MTDDGPKSWTFLILFAIGQNLFLAEGEDEGIDPEPRRGGARGAKLILEVIGEGSFVEQLPAPLEIRVKRLGNHDPGLGASPEGTVLGRRTCEQDRRRVRQVLDSPTQGDQRRAGSFCHRQRRRAFVRGR